MNSADSFSANYPEARTKFLEVAREAGAIHQQITHPEKGPDGGDLSTDVAWLGPRDAERVLVMISGTHGVEGFCGSGAQVDWLRRGEASRLPSGMAALMIHAVNPYGFAWLRRVTNENVDLNRNWVDFSAPLPKNPGYDELSEAICPASWTPQVQEDTAKVLGAYLGRNGPAALQQALSGGQYSHPSGVFYGGAGPTWSRRTQTEVFETWLAGARRVAIIDYHTGLGPWGYGEQIITERRHEPAFHRAAAWYGAAVTSPNDGTSTSAPISGDGLAAAPRILRNAEVTGMALEVGTLPLNDVFLALRADAWLHAYADPLGAEEAAGIKSRIRDAFYGDADDWKGMVAGQSLLACRQAVAGLLS